MKKQVKITNNFIYINNFIEKIYYLKKYRKLNRIDI